jgi:ABC-2 type transport system ATP-binding protein
VLTSHLARIECDLPTAHTGAAGASLPPLSGDVSVTGRRLRVRTAHLQADLQRLLSWADSHRIDLAGLSASDASLADVFASVVRGDRGGRTPKETIRS